MSAFGFTDGQRLTVRKILTDTSATTLLDASTRQFHITGILLVNKSGGALTPTVDIYDGTSAFCLRDDASLADQAREVLELPGDFIALQEDDLLRVTAAADLHIIVSYVDPYSVKGMALNG